MWPSSSRKKARSSRKRQEVVATMFRKQINLAQKETGRETSRGAPLFVRD
jgi:hypothetical protein